jgi:hypothetical protein
MYIDPLQFGCDIPVKQLLECQKLNDCMMLRYKGGLPNTIFKIYMTSAASYRVYLRIFLTARSSGHYLFVPMVESCLLFSATD